MKDVIGGMNTSQLGQSVCVTCSDPAPTFTQSCCEQAISFRPHCSESLDAFVRRLATALREAQFVPLLMLSYGPLESHQGFLHLLRQSYGPLEWPLQWVEGQACRGECMAGVQIYVLRTPNESLQRLVYEGRVVGSVYEDDTARHCLLGGLGGHPKGRDVAAQTEATFHALQECLRQAGLSLADLARTWFYNDRILEWYSAFNEVRNRYYSERPFRIGSLPASTAVAGRNSQGAALQLAAWALRPLDQEPELVRELASPLQCPAPAYGSAFSRAVEIGTGSSRRILVSGTASIEPGGRTVFLGNVESQIALSMEVVSALLQEQSMDFQNCTRAIVYFKAPSSLAAFEGYLKQRGLESLPYVPVHCDICRDDLLFEIELDAAQSCVSK